MVGALVMFNPVDDTSQVAQDLKREQEIKTRAYELLAEHGLEDWFFEFHDAKHRIGQCIYSRKVIAYSRPFINSSWDSIEDTLLHEIAHALVGPKVKSHGYEWRMKARELGADPSACTDNFVSDAKPNYYIMCSGCGRRWYRFRLKRKMIGRLSSCCREPLQGFKIRKGE